MVTQTTAPRAALIDRWLSRYTLWAAKHPWRVLLVALLALAGCAALASQLRIKGDFVSLLPSESGTARRFRAALERKAGGASTLVTVIESPDAAANERFIDSLAAEARRLPASLISSVQTGAAAERRYFTDSKWLFASEKDLRLVGCELRREREQQALDLGLDEPCDVQVADELKALGNGVGDSVLSVVEPAADATPTPPTEAHSGLARARERIERELAAQDRFKSDYFRNPDGTRYALVIRTPTAGMG